MRVKIKCPMCTKEKEVPDDYGPRPFCSTRCKLADLNNWLNERYAIPVQATLEGLGEDASQD